MDVLTAIGDTFLVRLGRIVPPACADILVKLEWENPTGSLKDRMAFAVVTRADWQRPRVDGSRGPIVSLIARTVVYATVFAGVVLVLVPVRLLSWSGIERSPATRSAQVAGAVIVFLGAVLALWCVATFVRRGQGTPAPFDPPGRLVVSGPYRFVRNPMYLGAGLAVGGAALYHASVVLLGYLGLLVVASHLFVVHYEEPTLLRKYGEQYGAYRRRVRRWVPRRIS